jgi:hypothetical protein
LIAKERPWLFAGSGFRFQVSRFVIQTGVDWRDERHANGVPAEHQIIEKLQLGIGLGGSAVLMLPSAVSDTLPL